MFSTGIGLVLKGFERMEMNDTATDDAHQGIKPITHNDPKLKESFFNKILNKFPRLLEDE
jgi:hypothetical protein